MRELRVPALGESIVEATVSKWLKQEGETVAIGEPIVELETDKVNLEVPSDQAGVIGSIVKAEGATVAIGDVLAIIGEVRSQPRTAGDGRSQSAQERPPQPAATPQPAPAPATPPVAVAQQATPASQSAPVPQPAAEVETLATPVAMRMATENDVDVRQIRGTGPDGRVTKEDVMNYLQRQQPARQPAPASSPPPASSSQPAPAAPAPTAQAAPSSALARPAGGLPALPGLTMPAAEDRREERMRMSRRRQTIARRLVEAQHTAAMLTTFNEIDMSAVMNIRQRRKEQFKERYGVSLGFMSFFTRAAVGALKAFPLLNAEIQGDEIVVKHYYDIGIAVGTDQGLVVPVLRDADRKSFAQIEREIGELANRARENTLTLGELQGGTFSVTNGGIYGSLMSTPILNTPQVGILGLHKVEERPVAVKGEIVIRPMMYVALSYDHRIVDGSDAVRFLVRIKELVEDPEALLLEG